MKFKLIESVKLLQNNYGDGMYVCDTPLSANDILLNKPKLYRFLYDSTKSFYLIGDAIRFRHDDLIDVVAAEYYYADVDIDEYVENGDDRYLFYYVFDPTKDNMNDFKSDDYKICYSYTFGNIYSRKRTLEDTPLYKVFGEPEDIFEM